MNRCGIERAPGRLLLQVMFAALGGVMMFAPFLIGAQTPSRRADPTNSSANQQASSQAAASQLREAASLLEQGRPGEAEPILRQVLLATPRNPDAHNLLGIILDQRGQFKDAELEYRAALQLNPNGISPLANLGVLLARTGRSDAAIKAFETVLKKVPNHPQST